MTRQRTLRADMWRRRKWLALDPMVRFTSIGLQASADDQGRGVVDALLIKADVYPLDVWVTADEIESHVLQLSDAGFLVLYAVGSETFYEVVDWPRVDRPAESDIPPPPPLASHSGSAPDRLRVVEGEGRARAEGASERGREGGSRERSSGADPEASSPPDPFCPAHPDGTPAPCRACGTARLRHSKWWQEQQRAAEADSPPA